MGGIVVQLNTYILTVLTSRLLHDYLRLKWGKCSLQIKPNLEIGEPSRAQACPILTSNVSFVCGCGSQQADESDRLAPWVGGVI